MAEITLPQRSGKRKPQVPRIDLTPMVDLGFLLITFFMYTTTMTKLKAMDITMPDTGNTDQPTVFNEESTITIIPVNAHKIIYYHGALNNGAQLHTTDFSTSNGLRDILLKKQDAVRHLPPSFSKEAHELHVLIKPADNCTYDDVVKILDEMNILAVPYYAMVDISAREKELLSDMKK